MPMMRLSSLCVRMVAALGLIAALGRCGLAADPSILTPGSRVAIVGDSITEQKLYSKYLEAYLLACSGVPDVKVFQFGWSGESAGGFSNRVENDLAGFQPTIVTLCYGMNDGGYQPWREQIGMAYEGNMRAILTKLDKMGVKKVVIGSPGAVDTDFFRNGQKLGELPAHEAYNDNLAHLRDIDRKLAEELKQPFANVHDAMFDTMKKAKAALGNKYHVCGGDGFHPGPNGQLIMAYAFLKGLGVDGKIGEITVDLKGTTTATEGHKVAAGKDGKIEIESTRWPFCFEGDGKAPESTRSIVPFLPFNEDLNRLTLKVTNLDRPRAKVQWGMETKEFSADQLKAGINLAAEFSKTPFDEPFQKLVGAVAKKQNFETPMIKTIITSFRSYPPEIRNDEEVQTALKTVTKKLHARQAELDGEVRKELVPVKHTLTIIPVE